MRRTLLWTFCLVAAMAMLAAVSPKPRYVEELVIGGGYGDPVDGGADLEKDGDIATNGKLTVRAASADSASVTLPPGTAPSAPVNGDLWTTSEGLFCRVNGATVGPLIAVAGVPWATPGAIGSTTPNSGAFTNGTFSGSISLSGSSGSINATSASQLTLSHTKATGPALLRLSPIPADGAGSATVDFFRSTATSGYVSMTVYRGDGSSTGILEVKAGAQPATYFKNSAGATQLTVDHPTGNLLASGDGTFSGGDVTAGVDSTTRGVLTLWDGSGGNAPGCIKLASPNGTIRYLFVEDDGTVKVSSTLPTQNSDGSVVGAQF